MTQTINVADQTMPAVGLGLWKIDPGAVAAAVYDAIKAGYRHLDSAADYGNEVQVGEGIARAIAEGLCLREELWVTSKLWNTYHRKEHVEAACRKSLDDLGLDYFDLYLGAMEQLVGAKLARQIGICNYSASLLHDLMNYANIKPAMLQIESHPYLTQEALIRTAQSYDIAVTAFSPLGALSYVALDMASEAETVLTQPIVLAAAQRTGATPAQVVLRWGLQRGTAVIPKTSNPQRLLENLSLSGFTLTDDEMAAISGLNQNRRFNDPGAFCEEAFNTFHSIYD